MSRRLSVQDYTVGWICALPDELAAAAELLDEEHQGHPNNPNDNSLYTLGCMSGHNIVIACLPSGQHGTSSAATVASCMKSTFTSVRFGLMVGIGGGVPSGEFDIRLGDVVVSLPHIGHGGVIQYDFGKTEPSGFLRTGALNNPPALLLSAVSTLRANHYREMCSLLPYVDKIGRRKRFKRTSTGPDVLFEATYNHVVGTTCEQCDKKRTIQREERECSEIVVHYGTIASGNCVMKDGKTRDQLSMELGGVLCFEMEAAGLMNSFPCLVIRGISDYADSHKNKTWQPYAAAVAAAYGKGLLSIIPAAEVVEQRTVHGAMDHATDSAYMGEADLKARLAYLARGKYVKFNWRTSVMDLLKLLELDSGLGARGRLAKRLHVYAGPTGSTKQNTALYDAVMNELAVSEQKWMDVMENRKRKGRCRNCGFNRHVELECQDNCGKCLYPGHTASRCRYLIRCIKCEKLGHLADDCAD
ncbi:purine and uridine phosphorylase [Pyrenochaeta sp. DS3sAY3a]|nr:purine and uridine phosphorylase [Pyrenochaeta sp. DS3sAY3a]